MKRDAAFELVIPVVLVALLALLVAPLATPYWWDEGAVYAPGAKWLFDHGFDARPGIFPSDLSRGHTPLFYLLLAAAFRLARPGPIAGHALAFGFASMALLYTYALGRRLFGALAGTLAAALLLTTPLFLTMSSQALPEMALTALTAASFHALARGRIAECAIWGTLLVLIKETGVACPLAIAGALALEGVRSGAPRQGARRGAVGLVPIAVLALFFLVQKRAEGWFFLPYHTSLFYEHHAILEQLGNVAVSIFVADGRIIAVIAAIALLAWRRGAALGPSDEPHRAVLTAFALHAIMNLGFFAKMFFLERYTLPVHVSVVVVLGAALAPSAATVRGWLPGLWAAALSIGVALSRRSAGSDMASGETTFQYLHAVHAYSALYGRLDAAGGNPVVLTDWPVTDELREPFLGWVKRPFRCVHIGDDTVGTSGTPNVDCVIAVRGLGSYGRLVREAHERGFQRRDHAEDGAAAIELWGP
jgi:4-amino-4-deoxy-L-arabinose transferase-like glycosyltransferase